MSNQNNDQRPPPPPPPPPPNAPRSRMAFDHDDTKKKK